jgi:hypothetical protein
VVALCISGCPSSPTRVSKENGPSSGVRAGAAVNRRAAPVAGWLVSLAPVLRRQRRAPDSFAGDNEPFNDRAAPLSLDFEHFQQKCERDGL